MGHTKTLKVMVLAGGPDRERPVSLMSGQQVAAALQQAGHQVRQRDIGPENLAALEEFGQWSGDVIFPVLHGAWGEGGPLQRLLEQRRLVHVGSGSAAAELCMDKQRSKQAVCEAGLPTPPFELVEAGRPPTLPPPLVFKPLCEGSSIDVVICRDAAQVAAAHARLTARYPQVMVEQFIVGLELTVGIIGAEGEELVLPALQIIPAGGFYDYDAKYVRDDTQYRFDIDLPPAVLQRIGEQALAAHRTLGCRHLSRVDFMVDARQQPWFLEVNTLPGFTSHSLVPKAAAKAGIGFVELVDRLARLPLRQARS